MTGFFVAKQIVALLRANQFIPSRMFSYFLGVLTSSTIDKKLEIYKNLEIELEI